MPSKKAKTAVAVGGAALAAIALAAPLIEKWEGFWPTAKIDTVGTGQPVTIGFGTTKVDLPNLKVGQKITMDEAKRLLEQDSLPKYEAQIAPCIHVPISPLTRAAFISMSYNAGPDAVCKSVVVAKLNAGQSQAACAAIKTWYIRARGVVVKGLQNRRADESKMCSEGLKPQPKPPQPIVKPWWQRLAALLTFRCPA